MEEILALSYYDLLTACSHAFSIWLFQEATKMHKKMLIRLWIAEGFIAQTQEGKAKETMELEDEAEIFLRVDG